MSFDSHTESSAPDAGFFLWDIAANRIQGDDAYLALHGFGAADVAQGLSIQSVIGRIHPDDSARIAHAMPATIIAHESYLDDYRIVRPEGDTIWVQSSGRVFADASGPTYCVGIVFPIAVDRSTAPREIVRELCSSAHAVAKTSGDLEIAAGLQELLLRLSEPLALNDNVI